MNDFESVTKAFDDVLKIFPKQTEKFMKDSARELRADAVKIAKHRVKKHTGRYLKGLKAGKTVYKWADADYNIMVYNSARHAHLIELGHWLVIAGRKVAWIVGKFVLTDAIQKYEPKFAKRVEDDLADYMAKGLEK